MRRYRVFWFIVFSTLLFLGFSSAIIVQADFGTNWQADFFNSNDLGGSIVQTITGINGINFNWGTGKPVVNGSEINVGPETFSVRFTSTQSFQQGAYNFVLSYDDGARMTIDGTEVMNQFNGEAGGYVTRTFNFTRDMVAGNHTLVVEYFDGVGNANIQVQWFFQGVTTPGTPGTVAPVSTAVPPLTVSVEGVRGLALRTGPYLGASLIGVVRPGTAYSPTARNRDEGQYTWYQITVNGRTGWSSDRFLTVSGDPNSVPQVSTIFEQIDSAPDTGVIGIPRAYVHFRRRPGLRSASMAEIPWGTEVQIIGRTRQGGEDFWYHVRWNGQVGWISALFTRVRGNIDNVPVR
jgi:hypothetical protein